MAEPWQMRSACQPGAGADPEWFWPERGQTAGLALHICRTHCPVRPECARHAAEHPPKDPQVIGGVRWTTTSGSKSPVRPSRREQRDDSAGCPVCPAGES